VIDIEAATIEGVLVDMGSSFPALVPGSGIVQGEIVAVLPKALKNADRLEGIAHRFYERRRVIAWLDCGAVLWTWAYFYSNPAKIADYPRLVIDHDNGIDIYAWRVPT
jgi:gamma-glutamylcyclotransferase (GGCT)/AIG2-like uncharacterized protein YtfP